MNQIKEIKYDLAVIGGGPGGYVAAIRGGQLGLKVALVEKAEIGGVCLNRGCIPTKALIKNAEVVSLFRRASEFGITYENLKFDYSEAVKRSRAVVEKQTIGVTFLLKKNSVDVLAGNGSIKDPQLISLETPSGESLIHAKNILLATGSRVKSLPGIQINGGGIIGSDEALSLTSLPRNLLIVGGGAAGVEFAYIFSAYGVEVTLIEAEPRLLPREDDEIGEELAQAFTRQKIKVKTDCRIGEIKKEDGTYSVQLILNKNEEKISFEKILMATGRAPNSENLGLENIGVHMEKGYILSDNFMQTNVPGIYAIGDVTGKALLAHTAMAEGIIAVEKIAGKDPLPLDYLSIPNCVFCQPQVASMGYTERVANEKGYKIRIGKFPYRANGKAAAVNETEGFVKLVTDAETGELLGAHLISTDATEHISELVLARKLEATAEEIAHSLHPHPTFSEAIMEAAEDVLGKAVHIWRKK
ncbi:MAG: dihydrolipoyl dehydrogenase [Nitrospiria bacterium]